MGRMYRMTVIGLISSIYKRIMLRIVQQFYFIIFSTKKKCFVMYILDVVLETIKKMKIKALKKGCDENIFVYYSFFVSFVTKEKTVREWLLIFYLCVKVMNHE